MAPEMVVEMRADQRSDIFSLGSVMFEILTGERLFTGDSTAEILERVVAGEIPKARSINPLIPEAVEAILSRALERPSARRFPSAAAMGEACEHFLYDKGYGPTNLTLKHYLASIFGEGVVSDDAEPREHEPTLVPLRDEMSRSTTASRPARSPRSSASWCAARRPDRATCARPRRAPTSSSRERRRASRMAAGLTGE